MPNLQWLDLSVDQAQMLSRMALVLFAIVIACILICILLKLKPRVIHWVALIAFSTCLLMGVVTAILYFWHHFARK